MKREESRREMENSRTEQENSRAEKEKRMEEQRGESDVRMVERMAMQIDSRSSNEEFARVVAAVFASRLNPTVEELEDIKTAVSEAVTNAVIHGYRGGKGTIFMEITAEVAGEEMKAAGAEQAEKQRGGLLTVTIRDAGVGIADVKRAMEPMYTTDCSGERSGMGFSFMEAFMDRVQVESMPGAGTTVIMKKRIGG